MLWTFLFLLGICFVFTGMALAQVDQGAINGVVNDSAGAAVPHAAVTLTNTDVNFVLQEKADARGQYSFSPIKIGHYTLSATAPKFATTTQENITVNIQDILNIPLTLRAGGVTENVTVTSAPPMLQSESASVGQVMTTQAINATPLNGRNWVDIAQLTAGVVPALGSGGGVGNNEFSANGQRDTQNDFRLDGVDNNSNEDSYLNGDTYNVRPPPDALAEFKLETSNYSAEFGHSSAAVLNASTKAGTNHIHGDLWEYVRNTAFDSADWDSAGGVVPILHENQFGATLGGPILKNKLFYFGDMEAHRITGTSPDAGLSVPTASVRNGDLSEYFNTSINYLTTPLGTFYPNSGGELPLTASGGAYANPAIASPALCTTVPQYCAWDPASAGGMGTGIGPATTDVMTPGDVSVGGLMDTVGHEVLNDYPHPNTNGWTAANYGTPGSGKVKTNYNVNLPKLNDTIQWDQRLDWNPSAKNQAYARYSYTHQQTSSAPPLGVVLDGGGTFYYSLGQNFMASETHLFNPTLINEARFGYNWNISATEQAAAEVPASVLVPGLGGVPFYGLAGPNGGLPYTAYNGTIGLSHAGSWYIPDVQRQNVYQILDNVTKVRGSHSIKFGIQIESIRTSFSNSEYARGRMNWDGFYSEKWSQGQIGTKNTNIGIADSYEDNQGNIGLSPFWDTEYYRNYRAAYVQDDWKVNSKLTANIGLRYDYIGPFSSKPGDVANIIITSQEVVPTGSGTAGSSAKGTGQYVLPAQTASSNPLSAGFITQLANDNVTINYTTANPHSLVSVDHYNFAPRLGLAYQVDAKTVVRAAYGVFYGGLESPGGSELQENFPFSYSMIIDNQYRQLYGGCYPSLQTGYNNINSQCPSNGTPDLNVNNPNNPYGVGNYGPGYSTPVGLNPFPYATNWEIEGSGYVNAGLAQFGSAATVVLSQSKMKSPYTQDYNLTVERQITKDMVATVAYVGNNSRHGFSQANIFGFLGVANPTIPCVLTGTTTLAPCGTTGSVASPNGMNSDAFPGFYSGGAWQSWFGARIYDSLQTKLEKRFSGGLSFLASYTWAHARADYATQGNGGGINSRNINLIPLRNEFTNDNFDVRHRVTLNGLYELPFGKGRKYMHQGGILDYLVGGWSDSATWVAQTGIPFTVAAGGGNWSAALSANQYNALMIRDPFKGGGTPDPSNIDMYGLTCPTSVHNRTTWYNPCAFIDPLSGASAAQAGTPTQNGPGIPVGAILTDTADAIKYFGGKSNQVHGPGFEDVNMSIFKNFKTWREQYVQFRADAFNLFNTPTDTQPANQNLGSGAGLITGSGPYGARVFELSAKYVF